MTGTFSLPTNTCSGCRGEEDAVFCMELEEESRLEESRCVALEEVERRGTGVLNLSMVGLIGLPAPISRGEAGCSYILSHSCPLHS